MDNPDTTAAAFRIFISCVSKEFGSYRNRLRGWLTAVDREIKIQEDFQDGSGTLLEKLDSYIVRCRAVIHLVGLSTGERAKPAEVRWLLERHPGFCQQLPELAQWLTSSACPFTYTQWECFLAVYHRVPCFIYRAGAHADREDGWVLNEEAAVEQEAHVERLRSLGQDRRVVDFRDAKDVAIRFLNSWQDARGQAAPKPTSGDVIWPLVPPLDRYPLADRGHEVAALWGVLSKEAPHRVLAIYGPTDRGKSALLGQLFAMSRTVPGFAVGRTEFKKNLHLADALGELRAYLGAIRFPRFERALETRNVELIRSAFLFDLGEARLPVLLLLDAVDDASEETMQWIHGPLLRVCQALPHLRVVLAGKSVPDLGDNARLGSTFRLIELPPIFDPEHWCDFGRRVLGLSIPDDHVGTLVQAARGSPRVISMLLANLKHSTPPA